MIRALPDGRTDGLQKTWETFKLLRGEGYESQEVHRLHRLKRELQTTLEKAAQDAADDRVNAVLGRLEEAIP